MEQTVLTWLTSHGNAALFGLLVLAIVGLPIPGETMLLAAGVLVGQKRLGAFPTYVAAMTGAVVGISVSYVIGRVIGVKAIRKYGKRLRIDSHEVEHVRAVFHGGGKWGLMFGYFIPGVRHLTALVAGAANLEFGFFSLFAYLGACLWAVVFITLGMYLGDSWQVLGHWLHTTGGIIAAAVLVIVIGGIGVRWWSTRKTAPPA